MSHYIFMLLLCLFLLLTGLMAVTNFSFKFMGDIAGFSALISGAIGIVLCIIGPPWPIWKRNP